MSVRSFITEGRLNVQPERLSGWTLEIEMRKSELYGNIEREIRRSFPAYNTL
jgi:hypothetical protein